MIVGQGMEALRGEFGASPNISIVGAVDDLAHCYAGACCVVAPIFEGSGMKTKVAEALMFGKRIIGTSEAFSGYGPAIAAAGWRAEDANGFLSAIRDAAGANLPAFDPASRALYDASHSFAAAMNRMATIMLPASDRPRVAAETMVRGMTTPVS